MSGAASGTARKAAEAGPWRAVDPETGDLVLVCPGCWPEVAACWRGRADVTVRRLRRRPAWARCAVCEPEDGC